MSFEGKVKRYMSCERCARKTEQCQEYEHRGITRCMDCGGGIQDIRNRRCANCVDLPNRKIREQRSGELVVYLSEMTDEQIEAYKDHQKVLEKSR
jgi:hypothetical protein